MSDACNIEVFEELGYYKLHIRMFEVYQDGVKIGWIKLNKNSDNLSYKYSTHKISSTNIIKALDITKNILIEEILLK